MYDNPDFSNKRRYVPDPLGRLGQGHWEDAVDGVPSNWGLPRPNNARPFSLGSAVGLQGPNRRDDVAKVETLLGGAGYMDIAPTGGPTGYPGGRLIDAVKRFQKDNGLKVDGYLNPDGETMASLTRAVPARPDDATRRTMEFRPEDARNAQPTPGLYYPDHVYENGHWRLKTPEERARSEYRNMAASNGGSDSPGDGGSGGKGGGNDGGSGGAKDGHDFDGIDFGRTGGGEAGFGGARDTHDFDGVDFGRARDVHDFDGLSLEVAATDELRALADRLAMQLDEARSLRLLRGQEIIDGENKMIDRTGSLLTRGASDLLSRSQPSNEKKDASSALGSLGKIANKMKRTLDVGKDVEDIFSGYGQRRYAKTQLPEIEGKITRLTDAYRAVTDELGRRALRQRQ